MTAKEIDKFAEKVAEKMQPLKPVKIEEIAEILSRSKRWVELRINKWVADGLIKEIPTSDRIRRNGRC